MLLPRQMQASAGKARVESTQPGADVLSEQLVANARQPIGVSQQAVENPRREEQGASAQLILGEQLRQRLDSREPLDRILKIIVQPLPAPTGNKGKVLQRSLIGFQVDLTFRQIREHFLQSGFLPRADQTDAVNGLRALFQPAEQLTPAGLLHKVAHRGGRDEMLVVERQADVKESEPRLRGLDLGNPAANFRQEFRGFGKSRRSSIGTLQPRRSSLQDLA